MNPQSGTSTLPVFNGDKVGAKIAVMQGKEHTASEKTAWDQIFEVANRFIAADRYLLAVPMWNRGISYPLKHYVDVFISLACFGA